MDAAANNAGGVGPGVYAIITSTGSIPAGAHGVIHRSELAQWKTASFACKGFERRSEDGQEDG